LGELTNFLKNGASSIVNFEMCSRLVSVIIIFMEIPIFLNPKFQLIRLEFGA
jgi:hypothetical protein